MIRRKTRKKRKVNFQLLGIILVFVGILIGIIPVAISLYKDDKEKKKVKSYLNSTSSLSIIDSDEEVVKEEAYLLILEIPKLGLKRGVYSFESSLNTIEKNVQIMRESTLPDVAGSNLILEAHNGTAGVAFFKNLYQLEVGDISYIYYQGIQYTYRVSKKYDVQKTGIVNVYRDESQNTLTLITCKNHTTDQQIVVISYLETTEKY